MSNYQDQEREAYSFCSGCGEEIYVGEYTLDIYGMCVHDIYECVIHAVEAKKYIAGSDSQ